MTKVYKLKCEVCGNSFESEKPHTVCCSPECKRDYKARYQRQYKQRQKTKRAASKRASAVKASLDDTLSAARTSGMSYGKFVAMRAAEAKDKV